MGRILVPVTIVVAMAAFAVAALLAGLSPYEPGWWAAAVRLAVLGGIVPMIFAVTIRIVPVFSRRMWRSEPMLRAQLGLAIAGAWTAAISQAAEFSAGIVAGHLLALGGGIVYTMNVAQLFRQPVGRAPAPPRPFPEQEVVDRVAIGFTRLSGIYLLVGLLVGVITSIWEPTTGRWDLVWAHTLLVGFFLSMASGVCYHVLSRWTGRPWRWPWAIRLHLLVVMWGLPLMLLALALDRTVLFGIAGPLQVAGVTLLLVNVLPMLAGLPALSRVALLLAAAFLATGIGYATAFALDPAIGARYRFLHAELNLFGWTGLLICGVGYYLLPRMLGRPLRWPRLAGAQVALLATGVALSAAMQGVRMNTGVDATVVAIPHVILALGFVLFGALIASTVLAPGRAGATASVTLRPRPNNG